MTTITIDRAVAQQALDFIVATNKSSQFWLVPESNLNKTVTALRAALAQQDEPLNLADPAVRKRLAAQWGYVPAAQAEPVEPVAALIAQRDVLLEALKEITPSICHVSIVPEEKCAQCGRIVRARVAIKAVEEGK